MSKKLLFISIIFYFFCSKGLCQFSQLIPLYKGHYPIVFRMLDKKIWDLFDSTKSNGFVIISFEISESGNVEGIEFSKNLPLEIKNVITNSLLATNGSWQPANVNGLSIRKRILQPIVYQYKGNQNYDIDINEIEKAFDFEKKWRELENKKYMDAIILPLCLTGFSVTKSKP